MTVATLIVLGAMLAGTSPTMSSPTPQAGRPPSAPAFNAAWKALLGDWTGEGGGEPGAGGGTASFRFDLEKHVIIRRGTADYPAAGGRPATHHEDLTVICPDDGSGASAIYFDNEGHVIRYRATWSADAMALVFLSAAESGAPRYRLTYTMLAAGRLGVRFEMAPPGGGPFTQYVSGTMTRASAP